MNIDRMLFVEMCDGIHYSGEIVEDDFYKSGIILKLSEKSEVKVWIPLERIKNIYYPDRSKLEKDETNFSALFQHMEEVKAVKRSVGEDE